MTKIVFPVGLYACISTLPFPLVGVRSIPIPDVIWVTIPDNATPSPINAEAITLFKTLILIASALPKVETPETFNCDTDAIPPITSIAVFAIPIKLPIIDGDCTEPETVNLFVEGL